MVGAVELLQLLAQRLEILQLAEVHLDVGERREKRIEDAVVDGLRAREGVDLLGCVLAERVLGQVVHRRTHHRESRGQRALLGQVVQRRQKLAAAEVARGAEDDHDRGVCDPVIVQAFS